MAATYTPIASVTLGSNATSVTFSSIPQTYTDLVLVTYSVMSASGNTNFAKVNSDSGSNYSYTVLNGNGSTARSARGSSQSVGLIISSAYGQGTTNTTITHFFNYANTTTNKTSLSRWNDASTGTELSVGLWRSTSAITTLDVVCNGGGVTFQSGSTFNLYGILGANA